MRHGGKVRFSRRGFAAALLGLLLGPRRLTAQSAPASAGPELPTRLSGRTYRADAVILFVGLPIYRRAGVGGGKASLEETGEGAALRRTFFFAAGSDPKRAHGLSRLGWIREVVVGPAITPAEVSYFGIMTSSPEESLDHARKSVDTSPGAKSTFAAVSGRNTAAHSRSALTHFEYSSSALWSDAGLIGHAQSIFRGESLEWRETAWPNSPDHAPLTFLAQLANLLKQRTPHAVGRYVYNEQDYLLELNTQKPTSDKVPLLPVRGKLRNLRTSKETPFRIWLENGSPSPVPVRIEFQARSFLRLTFEAVSA
jgi:hypothetical protein